MKTLKNKLRKKELTIGSWLSLGNVYAAEIMAKTGFDWLAIDMEHSATTLVEAARMIQVIDLCGVVPLVRVAENNPVLIKQVMDAGACGVIIPMVNSKEDALRAVKSVKYPPQGMRGVGLWRAQGYGAKFQEYQKWAARETVVIVQIEHIESVNNLEEIFSVEGIDAFMIGPYDLSGSLGVPGQFGHPDVVAALKRVCAVSKKMNMPSGYHIVYPTEAIVRKKINEGYSFIAYSTDFLLLQSKCQEGLNLVKKIIK